MVNGARENDRNESIQSVQPYNNEVRGHVDRLISQNSLYPFLKKYESIRDLNEFQTRDLLRMNGIQIDETQISEYTEAIKQQYIAREEQRAFFRDQAAELASFSLSPQQFKQELLLGVPQGMLDNDYFETIKGQKKLEELYREHVDLHKDEYIQYVIDRADKNRDGLNSLEEILNHYKESGIEIFGENNPSVAKIFENNDFTESSWLKGHIDKETDRYFDRLVTNRWNSLSSWFEGRLNEYTKKPVLDGLRKNLLETSHNKKDKAGFLKYALQNKDSYFDKINEYGKISAQIKKYGKDVTDTFHSELTAINTNTWRKIAAADMDISNEVSHIREVQNKIQIFADKKLQQEMKEKREEEKSEMMLNHLEMYSKNLPPEQQKAIKEHFLTLSYDKKELALSKLEKTCESEEKSREDVKNYSAEIDALLKDVSDTSFSKKINEDLQKYQKKYASYLGVWENKFMAGDYVIALSDIVREIELQIEEEQKEQEEKEQKEKEQEEEKKKNEDIQKDHADKEDDNQEASREKQYAWFTKTDIENIMEPPQPLSLKQSLKQMREFYVLPENHRSALLKKSKEIDEEEMDNAKKENLLHSLSDFITTESIFIRRNSTLKVKIEKHLHELPIDKQEAVISDLDRNSKRYKQNQTRWDYDYLSIAYHEDLNNIYNDVQADIQIKNNDTLDAEDQEVKDHETYQQTLQTLLNHYSGVLPQTHLHTIGTEMNKEHFTLEERTIYLQKLDSFCQKQSIALQKKDILLVDIQIGLDNLPQKDQFYFSQKIEDIQKRYKQNTHRWKYDFLAEEMYHALSDVYEQVKNKQLLIQKEQEMIDSKMALDENNEKIEQELFIKNVQHTLKKYHIPKQHRATIENHFIDETISFEEKKEYFESRSFQEFLKREQQAIHENIQKIHHIQTHPHFKDIQEQFDRITKNYENNQKRWDTMETSEWYGKQLEDFILRLDILTNIDREHEVSDVTHEKKEQSEFSFQVADAVRYFPDTHRNTVLQYFQNASFDEAKQYFESKGFQEFLKRENTAIQNNLQKEYYIGQHDLFDEHKEEYQLLKTYYESNQKRWDTMELGEWYGKRLDQLFQKMNEKEENLEQNNDIDEVNEKASLKEKEIFDLTIKDAFRSLPSVQQQTYYEYFSKQDFVLAKDTFASQSFQKQLSEEIDGVKKNTILYESLSDHPHFPDIQNKLQSVNKQYENLQKDITQKNIADWYGEKLEAFSEELLSLEEMENTATQQEKESEDEEETTTILIQQKEEQEMKEWYKKEKKHLDKEDQKYIEELLKSESKDQKKEIQLKAMQEKVAAKKREVIQTKESENEEQKYIAQLQQKGVVVSPELTDRYEFGKLEIFFSILNQCNNLKTFMKDKVGLLRRHADSLDKWFGVLFSEPDFQKEFIKQKNKHDTHEWKLFKEELLSDNYYKIDVDSFIVDAPEEEGESIEETVNIEKAEDQINENFEDVLLDNQENEEDLGIEHNDNEEKVVEEDNEQEGDLEATEQEELQALQSQLKKSIETSQTLLVMNQESDDDDLILLLMNLEGSIDNSVSLLERNEIVAEEIIVALEDIERKKELVEGYTTWQEIPLEDENIEKEDEEFQENIENEEENKEEVEQDDAHEDDINNENSLLFDSQEQQEYKENALSHIADKKEMLASLPEDIPEDLRLRLNSIAEYIQAMELRLEGEEISTDEMKQIIEELEQKKELLKNYVHIFSFSDNQDNDITEEDNQKNEDIKKDEILQEQKKFEESEEFQENIIEEEVQLEDEEDEEDDNQDDQDNLTIEEDSDTERMQENNNAALEELLQIFYKEQKEEKNKEEIQILLQNIIEESEKKEDILQKLKTLLSGVPSETLVTLVSKIMADYFGNEQVMATLLESHPTQYIITLSDFLAILQRHADLHAVALDYIFDETLLKTQIYYDAKILQSFRKIFIQYPNSSFEIQYQSTKHQCILYCTYGKKELELQTFTFDVVSSEG